jgi:ankyrin repeat protein
MDAALNGHDETVKFLLAMQASPDAKDDDGWTALMSAARNGHVSTIEMLLKANPDQIDEVTAAGDTALILAACAGHLRAVETLIRHGADVHAARKGGDGGTALMDAALHGHDEVVSYLLSKCARPETKDKRGWTALMSAASNGHLSTIEMLLQAKPAQKFEVAAAGDTALILAARAGHHQAIETLIRHGADVHVVRRDGACGTILMDTSFHNDISVFQDVLNFPGVSPCHVPIMSPKIGPKAQPEPLLPLDCPSPSRSRSAAKPTQPWRLPSLPVRSMRPPAIAQEQPCQLRARYCAGDGNGRLLAGRGRGLRAGPAPR